MTTLFYAGRFPVAERARKLFSLEERAIIQMSYRRLGAARDIWLASV